MLKVWPGVSSLSTIKAGTGEGSATMVASGDSAGTVGKALDVLDRVAGFGRPVRFSELLSGSPYPKATLYRLLQTLLQQGMVAYEPERQTYAAGLRLVRLAHAAWSQSSLAPLARPHLDALAARLGETIHLAELDQGQVLYVDKRNATRPVEMYSSAGKIGPAYCTGVGKAMLAHLTPDALEAALSRQSFHRFTPQTIQDRSALVAELAEVRARGFAFDREEHEPGIVCVAVPVLGGTGQAIGALSVTATTARSSLDALARLVPDISATATDIAGAARDWRFPHRGSGEDTAWQA